ncbi:MAG TPA: hypothetical protein VIH48_04845 [Candidatus Bathyarchaeia archaeon]
MKRWINFIGRIGTVAIAVGLAILIAYLIPPITMGGQSSTAGPIPMPSENFLIQQSSALSPQSGIRFTLATNGTLDMYGFEMGTSQIYEWLNSHAHQNQTELFLDFKDQYASLLVMQRQVPVGNSRIEHVPTKVENVTFFFVNPSQTQTVEFSWRTELLQTIAPKGNLLLAIGVTVPIGLILATPWLLSFAKPKRKQPKV